MTSDGSPDRGADDAGWSSLHGGIAPSRMVRGWLRLVRVVAGPLVRVPPDVLSAAGVVALAGAWAAIAGPGWPAVSVLLIAVGGLLDGLDGAVALATGRARPWGAVIDSVADRVGDVLLGVCLWALGAPVPWVLAAVGLVLLLEYLRARAQSVGMPGVGAVTVAERPTRLILVGLAAAGSAVFPAGVPLLGWGWGVMTAIIWTVVGVVGLAQLVRGVRRTMPQAFPPDR